MSEHHDLGLRRLLSRAGVFAVLLAVALLIAACGGDDDSSSSTGGSTAASSGSSGSGAKNLKVLTWETYHDKAWLDEFKQKTGIKVEATNVGSPAEMFAKVKANPGQFDIVLATAGWFKNYVEAGLLEPVDESKAPNAANIKLGFPWKDATSVDGKNYGILYNWGDQPLAWLPDKLKGVDLSKYTNAQGVIDDWNVLWDPAVKGKVSVFDDPTSVEPMVPLALGYKNPYQLNDQQFDAFTKKLNDLHPQVKRLTSGFDDQTAQFASGEATIGYLNNIASQTALKKKGINMQVNNLVKQGVPAWSDNYAITKEGGGKKLDAVYKFIDYTESLPWQARFIANSGNSGTLTYEQATTPDAQKAGLTKDKLAPTLIPATRDGDAFFSKMLFFQSVEDLQKRLNAWNEFKLGL
jgi:spermidine/putrescine transport system substrate-binding protein